MNRLAKMSPVWVLAGASALLSACGAVERLEPSGGSKPERRVAAPAPETLPDGGAGAGSTVVAAQAPIETFLANHQRLPARLKAATLSVRFQANVEGAVFDCAVGSRRDFSPCPGGDGHDFGRLVNGSAYQLKVRARDGASERVDETPLVVAFVADRATGVTALPPLPAVPTVPATATDLPSAAAPLLLQVGSFYGVSTAPGYLVTSYATTKTPNAALRSMRLTGRPDLSQAEGARPCDPRLERPSPGPDGLTYCESTPTIDEWERDFGAPMPQNHLEIVRGGDDGRGADEKLLVAAFDSAPDAAAGRLGIGATCQSAVARGETEVPLLYGYFAASPARVPFTWCQVRDRHGRFWWLGAFTAAVGAGDERTGLARPAGAPHLRVIYTASARLGIFSGSQFAVRAGDFIGPVLVPIAPAPDP